MFKLTIGELNIIDDVGEDVDDNDNPVQVPTQIIEAVVVSDEYAPLLPNDNWTGQTNMRPFDYDTFREICESLSIYKLFYTNSGELKCDENNFQYITDTLVNQLNASLYEYTQIHHTKPGFGNGYDEPYAWLIWLSYWVTRSYQMCKCPVLIITD